MKLTLNQAATALGKTRRQIVYMIEQRQLPAEKIGGRWTVDSTALPQDPAAEQRAQVRQASLRNAIEDALLPTERPRRYSLQDLKAFQIAQPLYRQLLEHPGAEHAATRHLHQSLEHLAQGCHRFARAEKARAYQAARDSASLAALELVLLQDAGLVPILDTLEQDLMPAIAGLLRRMERRAESPL